MKNKKTLSIFLINALTISGLLISHNALAKTFKESDINNDNKLSLEEVKNSGLTSIEKSFKIQDTNGDGFLDKAELKQAMINEQ